MAGGKAARHYFVPSVPRCADDARTRRTHCLPKMTVGKRLHHAKRWADLSLALVGGRWGGGRFLLQDAQAVGDLRLQMREVLRHLCQARL